MGTDFAVLSMEAHVAKNKTSSQSRYYIPPSATQPILCTKTKIVASVIASCLLSALNYSDS